MRRRVGKYRSKFERDFAASLRKMGLDFQYEKVILEYELPSKHKYKVDWNSASWPFYIETKGRFTASDRKKHIAIRVSNPDRPVRFVFQNAQNRLFPGSKTTYAQWCDANGFIWAETLPPREWFSKLGGK